jgi:hypothetical protein
MQALSQLSYSPTPIAEFAKQSPTRRGEFYGPGPKVSTVFWQALTVRVFFKLSDDVSSKLQQNK